jgi:hypothetical protein
VVRTGDETAELSRVLLARVEGAIAAAERTVEHRRSVEMMVLVGPDVTPSRDLLVQAEWNLAELRAWRIELTDELEGDSPDA